MLDEPDNARGQLSPGVNVPWWLWPNVLALDAPAVAIVWHLFLAARLGVAVPPIATAILGLTVWGVYLADRWLDAHRGAGDLADRHRFAGRHPWLVGGLAILALTAAAALAVFELPGAVVVAGGVCGVIVGGYLAIVHRGGSTRPSRGLKELAVGIVFAAGVVLSVAVRQPQSWPVWFPTLVALAALFSANCWLITRWEGGPAGSVPAAAAVGLATALLTGPAIGAAVVLAWAVLGGLHLTRRRLGPRRLRVLADAALLTPVFVVWLP